MKKLLLAFAAISALFFVSCGKEIERDECGCVLTLEDAKKDAQQNNRNIIFMITNQGGDIISDAFVSNVVMSEEFKNSLGQEFTVLHWDASQAAFEKTVANEDATKEEKAAAEKASKIMQENMTYALNIGGGAYSPQFFLLSKEAYVIAEVYYEDFEDEIKTEDFNVLIHQYDEPAKVYNEMIAATKTGSKEEKLKAIDNLYTSTKDIYRIEMIDLWKEGVKLDKKNESGLVGKFIYSIAESEAAELFNNRDVQGAIDKMLETAENPAINGEEVQNCYYLAVYLMNMTGSPDTQLMADLLMKSYEAAPDSEIAQNILGTAEYYKNFDPNEMIDLDYEDSGLDLSEMLDATISE